MDEIIKMGFNFGVPTVAMFYILMRLEPALKSLQETVTILTIVVAKSNNVDYEEAQKLVKGQNK